MGDLNKIPHGWALCDGNNGTPNLTGRFLQGWGRDDFYNRSVGEYIAPGLPNIWGKWAGGMYTRLEYASGAFWATHYMVGVLAESDNDNLIINFDASRCSWIYGNSKTVQPRAYVVYYIMRII